MASISIRYMRESLAVVICARRFFRDGSRFKNIRTQSTSVKTAFDAIIATKTEFEVPRNGVHARKTTFRCSQCPFKTHYKWWMDDQCLWDVFAVASISFQIHVAYRLGPAKWRASEVAISIATWKRLRMIHETTWQILYFIRKRIRMTHQNWMWWIVHAD